MTEKDVKLNTSEAMCAGKNSKNMIWFIMNSELVRGGPSPYHSSNYFCLRIFMHMDENVKTKTNPHNHL